MTNQEVENLSRMLCHDIGEALLKRYGNFRGQHPQAVAEYYGLIREEAAAVLRVYFSISADMA